MSFIVKPEPRDIPLPTFQQPPEPLLENIKSEHSDAARVYLDRGLPVPAYLRNGSALNSPTVPMTFTGAIPKLEEKVPILNATQEGENKSRHFTAFQSAAEISYLPEDALKEGFGMVKAIKESLKQLELGSQLRREVWDREICNLELQGSPRTLIAVCGATGAGKSSILNAILDDNIVPTSGMRACTAVVTELAFHKKSTIEADISFLSELEWRQELEVLLHDLVDEDGVIKRITDLKSDAGVAWQKVHAVYPTIHQDDLVKMNVNQIMGYDQQISQVLGTTKTIIADNSKVFAKEIGKYVDSKDQKRGKKDKKKKAKELTLMDKVRKSASVSMTASKGKDKDQDFDSPALWPLIRQVNVRCHAQALSTGAVLVDLPGVADANVARNNIAKDYMKKCNCIWILAPITRAVDDKTARDLLGDAFKMQLMNGNYDDHAITFIASKCDDISCGEVIHALHLEDDPQLEDIEQKLFALERDSLASKRQKKETEKLVKAIQAELKGIEEQVNEDESHVDALESGDTFVPTLKKKTSQNHKKRKHPFSGKKGSPKRRRRTTDSEDSEDDSFDDSDVSSEVDSDKDSDEEDLEDDEDSEGDDEDEDANEVTIDGLKEKIKLGKASIKATNKRLKEALATKKIAAGAISSLEKRISKLQREKNAFCSLKRSEFSRDVLKEDFRVGLKDLDDAAAEERDPENFNPSSNLRDYDAIDLPVFTCSSRDYVRIKGQVKGDGDPSCFSNAADTGIPDLQQWCHKLTISSRERAARTFMMHLKAFAQSIQSYVQGIGDVTTTDRETLREKWESRGFDEAEQYTTNEDPLDAILGGLGAGIGAGLYTLNKTAPAKVDPYGQPTGITPRLCTEFARMVDSCVHDLQQKFKDGLEDKCTVGALNAAEAALPTLDGFVAGMHWMTYRATLRRHGSWRRDLNVELINPFTRNIAHSWSKVFESDLFGPFETSTIDTITSLVEEVAESAAPGLKDRARLQGEICVQEARVALKKTVELVKETMNREQKEVSRCMAPHVQDQLKEGYDTAMLERGTGSVARQKAYFHGYIDQCKDNIFDDGAQIVLERLTKAAEAIGEALDEAMGKLAQKIEVSLAVLWEGARDNLAQVRARKVVIDMVQTIQGQLMFWFEADKMKQQAANQASNAMIED